MGVLEDAKIKQDPRIFEIQSRAAQLLNIPIKVYTDKPEINKFGFYNDSKEIRYKRYYSYVFDETIRNTCVCLPKHALNLNDDALFALIVTESIYMNSLFLSPERTIGYPALWSKTTIFCIFALAGIGGIAFYYKGTFYDENRSVLIRYIVYSFILLAIIASKFLSSKGTVGLYRRIVCCIFALACGAFFVKGIIDGSYELAGRIAFLFALSACVYIYIRENFAKTLYECKADKITVEKTGNAAALIEALNFMKRNETNKNALKVIEKRINGLNKTFQF